MRHSLGARAHSTTNDLKVAQTMLQHGKPDTTAGTCIPGVLQDNLAAQEQYVTAMMQQESTSQQRGSHEREASFRCGSIAASGWLSS